jgi:hypothetical protein
MRRGRIAPGLEGGPAVRGRRRGRHRKLFFFLFFSFDLAFLDNAEKEENESGKKNRVKEKKKRR